MTSLKSSNRTVRTGLAVLAVFAGLSVWMVSGPAAAQDIEIPIEQTVIDTTPKSTVQIGQADVPADLVGRTCEIEVVVTNQSSVHPGNNLIVASDGSSVTVEGVEDEAGGVSTVAGSITLGDTITVSVFLGRDSISSLGSNLSVTCAPLPPTPPAPTVVTRPSYTG